MLYDKKHAIFVALASLFTSASAAPASTAGNALTAPDNMLDHVVPTVLSNKKVAKAGFSEDCLAAWSFFDASKCWCHTGCALDCSQRGRPGTPGKDIHPDDCTDAPPKESCLEQVCDLVGTCVGDDATRKVDGVATGLDKLLTTAGYDCSVFEKIVKEDIPIPKWIMSKDNANCDATCQAVGKACNVTALKEIVTITELNAAENELVNPPSRSFPSPVVDVGWAPAWYSSRAFMPFDNSVSTCDAVCPGYQCSRYCACS